MNSSLNRVLVTGATGFIGGALVNELMQRGVGVSAMVRTPARFPPAVHVTLVDSITNIAALSASLHGVNAVVHCAARVHVLHDAVTNPIDTYRRVNVDGSVALARAAAAQGTKRFIFISSIKAAAEWSLPGRPLRVEDEPRPTDPYGISKLEAERALADIAAECNLELVIIRPPMVYGPAVRANFLSMVQWLARGIPLPFGGITDNRRSFVALDNLIDLIVRCLWHPAAVGNTFYVSDNQDLSTAELLRRTAFAMNRSARLVPVPASWLEQAARILGRSDLWIRLGGTLQLDISHTKDELSWNPPISVDEGLRRAVLGLGHHSQARR